MNGCRTAWHPARCWRSIRRLAAHIGASPDTAEPATAREQKLARLPVRVAQIIIDSLTGLLRQLELDWPSCLALSHCCAIDHVTVGWNVIDLEAQDITAPQLAIDSEVEHG